MHHTPLCCPPLALPHAQTVTGADAGDIQAEASKLLQFGRHPRFLSLHGVVLDPSACRPKAMVTELAVCSLDALAGMGVYPGSAPDPRGNVQGFVKKIAKHVLQGLTYMHSERHMHRDIKVNKHTHANTRSHTLAHIHARTHIQL